jgi:hypothetical protein
LPAPGELHLQRCGVILLRRDRVAIDAEIVDEQIRRALLQRLQHRRQRLDVAAQADADRGFPVRLAAAGRLIRQWHFLAHHAAAAAGLAADHVDHALHEIGRRGVRVVRGEERAAGGLAGAERRDALLQCRLLRDHGGIAAMGVAQVGHLAVDTLQRCHEPPVQQHEVGQQHGQQQQRNRRDAAVAPVECGHLHGALSSLAGAAAGAPGLPVAGWFTRAVR